MESPLVALFQLIDAFTTTGVAYVVGEPHRIEADVPREIWIATAEDTIVAKLYWYRLGHEVSELQWRDVKGVLGTQGSRLDLSYLRLWAERVGVLDLLELALSELE